MREQVREVFDNALYDGQDTGEAQGALASSLGCGVPTAIADLREGETVLDLGIAGALTERDFEDALAAAGLIEIEIRETHRVHEHAAAAIIRARKPAAV